MFAASKAHNAAAGQTGFEVTSLVLQRDWLQACWWNVSGWHLDAGGDDVDVNTTRWAEHGFFRGLECGVETRASRISLIFAGSTEVALCD